MVISSPCLTDIKNWLVQSKRLLQKSSSSSKSRLKNSYVFGYILQVIKKLKLKKHEVSTASTSVSTGSRVSTVSRCYRLPLLNEAHDAALDDGAVLVK
ncbi:hypothetical protein Tco_0349457, partial [Tanacetum coccineum]